MSIDLEEGISLAPKLLKKMNCDDKELGRERSLQPSEFAG